MSRSNPQSETKNPCTRWFEWSAGKDGGFISYYDKDTKQSVKCADGFTFIVLDELSTVRGWHDASDSGISANEVRDTKSEPLVVKAFKGGVLAEGLYASIRDRVAAHGGKFVSNIYCAYKDGAELRLGAVQFSGAALNAWVEFKKAHRKDILAQAIKIAGYTEGKKGSVTYRVPKLALVNISAETNAAATAIDANILQPYLSDYFRRPALEKAGAPVHADEVAAENAAADAAASEVKEEDSSVPF